MDLNTWYVEQQWGNSDDAEKRHKVAKGNYDFIYGFFQGVVHLKPQFVYRLIQKVDGIDRTIEEYVPRNP